MSLTTTDMGGGSGREALLPAGLGDLLPPDAAHEASVIEALVAVLAAHGYERAKPPLIEFEETLLAGAGGALGHQIFRLMDPVSQRMMGVRADITVQIARIARTRLARRPRPLRLAYAGQVLRVRGAQLRTERQFAQVGAELFGPDLAAADAEIAGLAAQSLASVGVDRLSLDLSLPILVPEIISAHGVEPEAAAALRGALDRKDAAGVAEHGGAAAEPLLALLRAGGEAEKGFAAASRLKLPPPAAEALERLRAVRALLSQSLPDLRVTVDLVEHRGFEYQTGVSFTLFARGVRGELGRGGRYATAGESATGFTLYLDSVLRAVPPPAPIGRLYLPFESDPEMGRRMRSEGWVTVSGLASAEDEAAEAARLGCSHWLSTEGAVSVAST